MRMLQLEHTRSIAYEKITTCINFSACAGFGNQFIFGYEVQVELSIQLEIGNEVEYE